MERKNICTFFLILITAAVFKSSASDSYVTCIPNGKYVVGGQCAACHFSGTPSSSDLTGFGEDFKNAGYTWNSGLSIKDSDGDGWLNDSELQAGGITSWTCLQPDLPAHDKVANPGNSSIVPEVKTENKNGPSKLGGPFLKANPNPFNAVTEIKVSGEMLLRSSSNFLRIYSLSGKCIEALPPSGLRNGEYVYLWDASGMPAGVYLLRAVLPSGELSGKVTLLK
ncbi:MAG: T9SS type A sorting domain-containing protein [Fibrobacterota bacterium]